MESAFRITTHRVDLLAGQIEPASIEVRDGRIANIDSVARASGYALPGFVDSHVHIESSMVLPCEFARAAMVHGTVATVSDPHEIANVCGLEGIELMLANAAKSPLKFHFGAPPCVPATPFETAGAKLGIADIEQLLDDPRITHLSEMMNFPGVLSGDVDVMSKIVAARARGLPIDGHAPGLRGSDAQRYFQAGISTDHECIDLVEAEHKIACGAMIAIREGSAARNFDALWPLIDRYPDRCMFCSDDKHPDDLLCGHINQLVVRAVAKGADLMHTLRVACVNPVKHYRLDVGLLQVGDPADFIVVEDLTRFQIQKTYIDGRLVAEARKCLIAPEPATILNRFAANPIDAPSLAIPANGTDVRVIEVQAGQIVTKATTAPVILKGTEAVTSVEKDLMKLVVVNRYHPTQPAIGFVRGFGLRAGALASSVAHDSHNIVAVGQNDNDLLAVINAVVVARGGLALSRDRETQLLSLPIAGLMSTASCADVAHRYDQLTRSAEALGCQLDAPFMTLSFLALPVIPTLKLTDKGLFDVDKFEFVPLFLRP